MDYRTCIEAMLFYCIFNGNYVSNNITYKPAIHLAVQTVYTTALTILGSPLRIQVAVVSSKI